MGLVLPQLKGKLASSQGDERVAQAVDVKGIKVLAARLEGADAKTLRDTMDKLKGKLKSAAIVLAAVDPFTKRYTHLPQVFLGAAFGWAVPMAFAAQTGTVPKVGWLLFIAAILWAVVYDPMSAMVSRAADLRIGANPTAILFGDADRLIIGIVQALLLGALVLAGRLADPPPGVPRRRGGLAGVGRAHPADP